MFSNIPINLLSETQLGRLFGFFIQRLVDGGVVVERVGETVQPHTLKLKHTLVYIYISQSVQFACKAPALHPSPISLKPRIHATLYLVFLYICVHMCGVQSGLPHCHI